MKEHEIRPAEVFQEYLRLSANDAEEYFQENDRHQINCPACNSSDLKDEFSKYGFDYVICIFCETLFLNPRPSEEAFDLFYKDSKSSRYWAEEFFPSIAEPRREKIFKPRVKRINDLCQNLDFYPRTIMDVGAGYGIFLEEWRNINPDSNIIGIEPSKQLAEICRQKDIKIIESMVEEVQGQDECSDLLVCFEVLEHVHSPQKFLTKLNELIQPGGYIVLSTLTISGFDIQLLWEKSDSISPPHHINFFSIKGFQSIFESCGFKDINIFTPGLLDVDIIKNALKKDPSQVVTNRFLDKIFKDETLSGSFQDYLSANQLSSHAWVLAKKI